MFSDKIIWGCWYFFFVIFRSVKWRGNILRVFKWGIGLVLFFFEGNFENFKD